MKKSNLLNFRTNRRERRARSRKGKIIAFRPKPKSQRHLQLAFVLPDCLLPITDYPVEAIGELETFLRGIQTRHRNAL